MLKIDFITQMQPNHSSTGDPTEFIIFGIIIGIFLGILALAAIELLAYFIFYNKKRQGEVVDEPRIGDQEVVTTSEVAKAALKNNFDPLKTSILQAVHNGDVLFQNDITELFKLKKTRVSELMTEFEDLGLIKRERSGRTYRIYSTVLETP
ncbi:MAG: helix-turn-helix transcriptional regulator [Candidatus Odinarchaeota archaeon]